MVGVGEEWLVMVGGVGGVWLVEVTGCQATFFFFTFSLMLQLLSEHTQHLYFWMKI